MSIKKKLPLLFTLSVFLILLLNNTFQYVRSKSQLLDYNEKQVALITKEVSFQVENTTQATLYVEDILARELRIASVAIANELPPDYHDVTNEQLMQLAKDLGVSHITLLAKTNDDIIGVRSSDPDEINMSTKDWGYWYDAFHQLFDLKPTTVKEGLSLPNYWSGPIEIAASDPDHIDKWGYYFDGTTNYMINPYFRDNVVLEYEERFGPWNSIRTLTKEKGILEISVINPKNFGKGEEIAYSNGNSFIRISSRPIWYGTYNYRNINKDSTYIEKAMYSKKTQSYKDVLNDKSVMKTFVPIFDHNKEQPYVIGLVYDYGLIEKQLYEELKVYLLFSVAIMLVVLFVSFIFSRSITRPIGYIVEQVNEIAEGKFGNTLKLNRKDELGLLTENVNSLSNRLRNYVDDLKQSKELIEFQAYHDPLTGMLNRRFLLENLSSILEMADGQGEPVSVLFIDLDRFKHVNDSLGHNKGDEILKIVADRIETLLPEKNNMIIRQGGDEFIILVVNSSIEAIKTTANNLIQALKKPYFLEGQEIHLGASCGISLYPEHTKNQVNLVVYADLAMYAAKKLGGNRYIFYDEELGKANKMKPQIESRLRKAIEQGNIEVYYQPKMNAKTNTIFGAEALVRWTDEELGFVPPDIFIPIAEDTGLIHPLWEFVMETACRQMSEWNKQFSQNWIICVNFSGRQFLEPCNMVNKIKEVLEATNLPPKNFEIEITESILINHSLELVQTLQSIKELGIAIAIDDFGTGYSSLSYLKNLPIDALKIDKSFIQNIDEDLGNSEIPEAVINLARSLHLMVIAEGVEKEYQKEFLLSSDCVLMQGYLFSKPLNKEDFGDFIIKYMN
ncbi:putative bifunctional diguanylate cyclase/phosphodiesterase [Neobacillus sp. K501]